ncbi:MAG: hypothetical protein A4E64_00981 [Syntrophorhabdus sp. PtaU1.Bin058]|nr:MAG: hypothetical protein A4E64_00981 [Syntrophorhabdus sp. PtaU1.Bin058]
MVVDQKDLQVFIAVLMPQGEEPRQRHGNEDQEAEPQMHLQYLPGVFVEDQERQYGEAGYNNPDETLYVKGKGAGDIT